MRQDFSYPFRIDPASGQAAQTNYANHVVQIIEQVLLTSPGERIDLPSFGCGVRSLLFAPNSDSLVATTQIVVQQALNKWLSNQITVQNVNVSQSVDGSQLLITIQYLLIETQQTQTTEVQVI